jgi:hypothetical protein
VPKIETVDFVVLAALLLSAAVGLAGTVWAVRVALRRGTHLAVATALTKNTRRLAVLIAGTGLILIGIVISPLPGPGLSILGPLGLAVMASEFVWARRLVTLVEQNTAGFRGVADQLARRSSRTLVIVLCVAYWSGAIVGGVLTFELVPVWAYWPLTSAFFAPIFYWAVKSWRLSRNPDG